MWRKLNSSVADPSRSPFGGGRHRGFRVLVVSPSKKLMTLNVEADEIDARTKLTHLPLSPAGRGTGEAKI